MMTICSVDAAATDGSPSNSSRLKIKTGSVVLFGHGMNSGARKNDSSASRPLNRKRTSPIAAMIPSAHASTAAESPSTRLILKNELTNSALSKKARYHRSVNAVGGKSKFGLAPNDTA